MVILVSRVCIVSDGFETELCKIGRFLSGANTKFLERNFYVAAGKGNFSKTTHVRRKGTYHSLNYVFAYVMTTYLHLYKRKGGKNAVFLFMRTHAMMTLLELHCGMGV